jgi:hypothetical protein
MRLLRLSSVVLAVLAGCADACGAKPAEPPAPKPAATTATAADPAAVKTPPAPVPPRPAWQPAPDSEMTRQLRAAQAAIEQDHAFDKLASEKQLRSALGNKIDEFAADGDASSSAGGDGPAKLAVAARNYKSGTSLARVRITDTGLLPTARRTVSGHLTLVGNEAAGHEVGAFVRGYPAVLGHYDTQHMSRATALIGERYLVQITVESAAQPDAAQHLLEALDWSQLAPKQGKPPNAPH